MSLAPRCKLAQLIRRTRDPFGPPPLSGFFEVLAGPLPHLIRDNFSYRECSFGRNFDISGFCVVGCSPVYEPPERLNADCSTHVLPLSEGREHLLLRSAEPHSNPHPVRASSAPP